MAAADSCRPPRIDLFGGVRVVRDGETFEPGPVPATILAMLALACPHAVTRHRLMEATWGAEPPGSARGSLQAHVSRLRGVLDAGRPDAAASAIEATGDGYRLTLPPEVVDVARFRDAMAGARTAGDRRAALDVVNGAPLATCTGTWAVETERRALEDERLAAVTAWAAAAIDEGADDEVVGELRRLTAEHPLRERLWALLIRSLGAGGRQADALDAYRRARHLLAVEAGVDPGPELEAAQREVLAGDVPTRTAERRTPRARAGTPPPAPRTPLVGRDDDVRQLASWLGSWRLVTIVGPGGAGKTRLATEVVRAVGDDAPGGTVFVDLTVAHDEADVVSVLASAVGVRMVSDRQRLVAAAAEQLGRERTVLLVDNCEHVLGEVARVVDHLLDESDVVTVLATSRRPLGVGGERLAPLGPLTLDAAVDLFRQRAEARCPGLELDEEEVRQLVRRLDGLPLAIELAAARTDHLAVTDITERVEASVGALERLDAVTDPRHRDLEAAIRWSYELCDPELQAVLRKLAVFRQPFGRDEAAAVAGDALVTHDIDHALGRLVGHSLVSARTTAAGGPRFRLLETIRSFARTELSAAGEADATAARHRGWYARLARRSAPGGSVLDLAVAYGLERHHADLVAALEDADRAGAHRDLVDLAAFAAGLAFCPAGLPAAGRWVERARELGPNGRVGAGDLLGISALVAMLRDDIRTTVELSERVAALPDDEPLGAGPVALGLAMTVPEVADAAARSTDRLLDARDEEIPAEVRFELAGLRQLPELYRHRDPATALEEASELWQGRRWSERRTSETWTIHAALLHVNGEHQALRSRLEEMERVDPALGPSTFFVAVFEALDAAVAGAPDEAVACLRRPVDQHWLGVPGVSSELVGTLAAVRTISGDTEGARRLLTTPGLRPRHPGTAIVHVFYRRLHDVDVDGYVSGWWGRGRDPEVAAVLEAELDRMSADR